MNIVCSIIIVLLIAVLGAATANLIEIIRNKNNNKISFKETMDLCDLPIVTFVNDNQKINFLLDTGASRSVLDENVLKEKELKYMESENTGTVYGMEGNAVEVKYVNMDITYKDNVYNEWFQVVDMSKAFSAVKQESGVNLHGILSSTFFERYKYVLDFADLVFYTK